MSDESTDGQSTDDPQSVVGRGRKWVLRQADDAGRWIVDRRAVSIPVDIAASYYERDRDAFGSVLGSAVAFRLFLFFVPLLLLIMGVAMLLVGQDVLSADLATDAGVSGQMAGEIAEGLEASTSTGWLLIAAGIFGTAWAGRSLTRVLAPMSAGAWRLDAQSARATISRIAVVTALFSVMVLASTVGGYLRQSSGLVVGAVSLVGIGATYGGVWFVVTLALPKGTSDPGAMLPGAAIIGVTMVAAQWFAQFYLPSRISSKSAVLGGMGLAVVFLGWLFIVGRIMVASVVINAVVYERIGSVSHFVFRLPVLRRIPARWPRVGVFFDLDGTEESLRRKDS